MAAGLGFKDFTTGEVLTAADVDGYLMQGVWVFASAAARDAAVTSPQEGNFAYLKDTNITTYYTGSAWANLDTTGMTNPMTTAGDTIYGGASGTPTRLAIGSTGNVLTVSGGNPVWAAPSAGSFVGCSVWASAEQSLTNNTNTILTFDSEDFDTDGFHSTSSNTGRITIPSGKDGKYQIQAFGNWANNSSGRRQMYLYKNGTAFALTETIVPSVTASLSWYLYIVVSAVATDYFELRATQTSGGALACRLNGDGSVDSISGRFQATFIGA